MNDRATVTVRALRLMGEREAGEALDGMLRIAAAQAVREAMRVGQPLRQSQWQRLDALARHFEEGVEHEWTM